ncbi:MAG: hypothetical protein IT214_07375 [Chitinophagaceae bacterium]|nr:hypothetical protein [Chitinophagaceae bacterium]
MKRSGFFKFSNFLLIIMVWAATANAQWYLDTATPQEATARDKPYQYLQNQIQKLCNRDWTIDKSSFKFLTDHSDWQKVVRGNSIFRFDLTGGGNACDIMMDHNSAIYRQNLLQSQSNAKEEGAIMKSGMDEYQKAMQSKDPMAAIDNYKKTHKKFIDSISARSKQLKLSDQHLLNEQEFANVSVIVNNDRIEGKDLQSFRTSTLMHLPVIPGIQQAILYTEFPDADDPDTNYRAALYVGNFPKYTGKMEPVNFKYKSKMPWKDKSHSGAPIVENTSTWKSSYHYNNLMKVIRTIDWSGLDSMIKNEP